MNLPVLDRWKAAARIWPFAFAALCLALGLTLDFQQFHNDFWDVHFVARHLDAGDPRTWFGPQVPIGSALFLRLISGSGSPVVPAILANIVFASATLYLCARQYGRSLPPVFALVFLAMLSLHPTFFHYANAGGGDPASVLMFTSGAFLALRGLRDGADRGFSRGLFAAGVLLGLAGLFRYHALVGAVFLWIAMLAAYPARWKALLLAGAGIGLGYCPQWIVNLAAGRGLMETRFGPMNVYFLMHGINWHRFTELNLPGVFEIIADDPRLFLRKYAASLWSFKQTWAPPLLAVLLVRNPASRKTLVVIALWTSLYFLMFSATNSGRQALLALPLSMLSFGLAAHAAWEWLGGLSPRRRAALRSALGALALMLLALHAYRDARFLEQRARMRDDAVAVETILREKGVVRAGEVFTSDFDLYFRTLEGILPGFNGGAPRQGTYLYNQVYPEFPVDTLRAFVEACRARGVRFAVLNPDCPRLSPAFAAFCRGDVSVEGLEAEAEAGRYRVFSVK